MRDPYEILQVSRKAEPEVIEAAYRRLARKYHPDVNPSSQANAVMKDLNWAYQILRDPLERNRYDRTHPGPSSSTASASYSRAYSPPPKPQSSSSPRPKPTPPPKQHSYSPPRPESTPSPSAKTKEPERSFFKKYWVWIGIGAWIIYIVARPQIADLKNSYSQVDSSTEASGQSATAPAQDPYLDCIGWRSAGAYDGQVKCVLGRIVLVTHEIDRHTGSDVWTGHFSFDPDDDFVLISVDHDISQWQGQCVSVYGKIFDRELIKEYADDAQPSMVDSDPFDDRGFTISAAPGDECYHP